MGADIDYAMLVKVYGPSPEGQKRYSPTECSGAVNHRIEGNLDPKYVSTSTPGGKISHVDGNAAVHPIDECLL